MVCQTLVTLKMDTLLFLWTLLTVPPYHLLLDLTSRQRTWIYVCNTRLLVSICAQLPCLGSNQVCKSMFSYKVAVSFLTCGQSGCHQPPPHPKPLVVCVHYKWLRITLPMCWTSHGPLLSRLSQIFPRGFILLQMSTAVSEQCGNNVLYLCKCIYMYI
jgi:hypothetical protein